MTTIGFHASHEQFTSGELRLVQRAQQAGFQAGMGSDHFYPWREQQGQSDFAWSWLGAALQATHWSFGAVNAPGQRYHPALIAQAAATLAQMFPQRFWCAFGTGHVAWLREYLEIGFERLYLHEAGPPQERFIDVFGEKVLPVLKGA